MMKMLRTRPINLGHFYQTFLVKMPQIFPRFLSFWQLILDMRVFIWSMGSPNCKDIEFVMVEVYFRGTWFNPVFGKKCKKLIGLILRIFIISTSNPWHWGVYKVHEEFRLRGYRNRYGGSLFTRHLFQPSFWGVWGVLGAWMTLKRLKWTKPLGMG